MLRTRDPPKVRYSTPMNAWMGLGYIIAGIIQCITIIWIPFGIASFKLAGLALVPFDKTVVTAGKPLPPQARVDLAL